MIVKLEGKDNTLFIIENVMKSNKSAKNKKKHVSKRRDIYEVNSRESKDKSIPLNTGRWTKSEHEEFLKYLSLYGNSWRIIAKHIKTRSSQQIRSHSQKYFAELIKKTKNEAKQNNEEMPFITYRAYRNYSSWEPLELDPEFRLSDYSAKKVGSFNKKIEGIKRIETKITKTSNNSDEIFAVFNDFSHSQENKSGSYQTLESLAMSKERFDHEIDVGLRFSSNFEFLDNALDSPRDRKSVV